MFLVNLSRVIKYGWLHFWRSGWLSLATIGTMFLTLVVIIFLLLLNVVSSNLLTQLEDKIDISVYFQRQTPEEQIVNLQDQIALLPEVKEINYISQVQALQDFKAKHADNTLLMQSLRELEGNPLEASLNIKVYQVSEFDKIVAFLQDAEYKNLIDKINYQENKELINKLSSVTNNVKRFGFGLSVVLALIALLVTFNTIRLAVFNSREEIMIMRLVGASSWYTIGPFLLEGVLYGAAAAIITWLVFYPFLFFISPKLIEFLAGLDIFYYFQLNSPRILFLLMLVGVCLGVVSSLVAARKYLKA